MKVCVCAVGCEVLVLFVGGLGMVWIRCGCGGFLEVDVGVGMYEVRGTGYGVQERYTSSVEKDGCDCKKR